MKKSFFNSTKLAFMGLLVVVVIGFSSCFPGYYDGYGHRSGYYDNYYPGYYGNYPRIRVFHNHHSHGYYGGQYPKPSYRRNYRGGR